MRYTLSLLSLLFALTVVGGARAANESDTTGPVSVVGTVPLFCALGPVSGDDNVFDLGILVDTATDTLLSDLAPEPKTIVESTCNTRSTISIVATPMVAQSFVTPAPPGFSAGVNFTATASNWTPSPAVFNTAIPANSDAEQEREGAFTGDISITLSNFTTVGGNDLRLVADPVYQGTVTVTLSAGS